MKKLVAVFALLCVQAWAATLTPAPRITFVNGVGGTCAGCSLYTYAAGTTTPLASYVDSAGVSQNTNPVILGTDGGGNIWLGSASYKFTLKDTDGSTIFTVDNIAGTAGLNCALTSPVGECDIAGILKANALVSVTSVTAASAQINGTMNANTVASAGAVTGVSGQFSGKVTANTAELGGTACPVGAVAGSLCTPTMPVDVTLYGADKTGVADSTTAICTAATAAQGGVGLLWFPTGTYKIAGTCTVTGDLYVFAQGTVTINQQTAGATTFQITGAQFISFNSSGLIVMHGGATAIHGDNADLEGAAYNFNNMTFNNMTSYPVIIEPTTGSAITFTGTTAVNSTTISSVSSTTSLVTGQPISGAGIPLGASVGFIGSGFITISLPATASASGVTLSAFPTTSYTQLSQISTFNNIHWNNDSYGLKVLEDRTVLINSWADWTPPTNNSAFIYNSAYGDPCASGHLVIRNTVLVPLQSGMTSVRWIDNYGSVDIAQSRFSSENGAYPSIYHFTPACTTSGPVFSGVQVVVRDSAMWQGSAVDAGILVIPPYGDVPNQVIFDGIRGNYPYINNQAGSLVAGTSDLATRLAAAGIPQYSWRFHIGVMVPADLNIPPATQGGYLLWPNEIAPWLTLNYTEDSVSAPSGNATNAANFDSHTKQFIASYWDGSAAALDTLTFKNSCASGASPLCSLTLSHSGSAGGYTTPFPLISTGSQTAGNVACIKSAGPPVVVGTCAGTINTSTGACSVCN